MIVRRGTEADREGALQVWRAALGARGTRPPATRVARVTDKLAQELLVVADDGAVIGMALGEPDRDVEQQVHVSMLFVAPDRWRTGVGSALLEGLADQAWGDGMRRLAVWTGTANAAARALYDTCGLVPTGRTSEQVGAEIVEYAGELEAPVRDVAVFSDGIRLGQFLKLAELTETGAQAKELLAEGGVQVNGEPESRRGRQLVEGDLVGARVQTVRVHLPR